MLEWYTVGQGLSDLIDQTQEIVEIVSQSLALSGSAPLARSGIRNSVEILRIEDLYGEFFGIDLRKVLLSNDAADFYASLIGKAISVRPDDSLDELFWKSFLDIIEPSLKQRDWVFLTGFPVGYASLAQAEPEGLFAERFELFSGGVEICNGYFELTDVDVMRNRFDEILLRRSDLRGDTSFDSAMQAGIPPCSGNALGLERLVSVIMGAQSLLAGHGLDSFSSQ
jgi:lysyl-tRNA synthetase class 2